jgi:hypothetical protein
MSSRILGLVVAAGLVVFGVIFTLQGLGYVGGSSMTGSQTWAVLGPLIAGLGVALGIVILQRRR